MLVHDKHLALPPYIIYFGRCQRRVSPKKRNSERIIWVKFVLILRSYADRIAKRSPFMGFFGFSLRITNCTNIRIWDINKDSLTAY